MQNSTAAHQLSVYGTMQSQSLLSALLCPFFRNKDYMLPLHLAAGHGRGAHLVDVFNVILPAGKMQLISGEHCERISLPKATPGLASGSGNESATHTSSRSMTFMATSALVSLSTLVAERYFLCRWLDYHICKCIMELSLRSSRGGCAYPRYTSPKEPLPMHSSRSYRSSSTDKAPASAVPRYGRALAMSKPSQEGPKTR